MTKTAVATAEPDRNAYLNHIHWLLHRIVNRCPLCHHEDGTHSNDCWVR